MKIEQTGQRIYLLGDTYPVKDQIKAAGGHWDPDRKAWWVGVAKRAEMEALSAKLGNPGNGNGQSANGGQREPQPLRDGDTIIGKAEYKGRHYILVWEGQTKRGYAAKLAFTDGSQTFWASQGEYKVEKRFGGGDRDDMTFGHYRRFCEQAQAARKEESASKVVARATAALTPEQIMAAAVEAAAKSGETITGTAPLDLTAKQKVEVGEVRHTKKSGYIIVAAVGKYERWYHSEDDCEDQDCFCGDYGWRESQQYWGVQIAEPASYRIAREKIEAAAKAKEDAKAKAKADYTAAATQIPADYRIRHGALYGGTVTIASEGGASESFTEPAVQGGDLAALKWEQVAHIDLNVAEKGIIAGRVMDSDTLFRAALPDGRLVFYVDHYRDFGDDLRRTYHLPQDVWEAQAIREIAERGITPERAAEWLAQSKGCVGTELYEFATHRA